MPAIDYRAARGAAPGRGAGADRLSAALAAQDQVRGPCPVHGSRADQPVFAAHLAKNVCHCFACGAGGNALDLWAALTRLPLHAAVIDLCQRLGQPVPWLRRASARGRVKDRTNLTRETQNDARTLTSARRPCRGAMTAERRHARDERDHGCAATASVGRDPGDTPAPSSRPRRFGLARGTARHYPDRSRAQRPCSEGCPCVELAKN